MFSLNNFTQNIVSHWVMIIQINRCHLIAEIWIQYTHFLRKNVFFAVFGLFDHIIHFEFNFGNSFQKDVSQLVTIKWIVWHHLIVQIWFKTHIFYEKTCFLAYFGLFYHIIRSNVSSTLIINSKMLYLNYLW